MSETREFLFCIDHMTFFYTLESVMLVSDYSLILLLGIPAKYKRGKSTKGGLIHFLYKTFLT